MNKGLVRGRVITSKTAVAAVAGSSGVERGTS